MLNVIRQQQLRLRVKRDRQQRRDTCAAAQQHSQRQRHRRPGRVAPVGVQAAARTQPPLGPPSGAERPDPGPRRVAVEPLVQPRRVRIAVRCRMYVMHPKMGRGVVPEQDRRVDRHPQQPRCARLAVDQLVRVGVADLADEQRRRHEDQHLVERVVSGAGQRSDRAEQDREMHKAQRDRQCCAGREFLPYAIGRRQRRDPVQCPGEDRDDGCRNRRPGPAQHDAGRQQCRHSDRHDCKAHAAPAASRPRGACRSRRANRAPAKAKPWKSRFAAAGPAARPSAQALSNPGAAY